MSVSYPSLKFCDENPVVDPGFPIGGDVNLLGGTNFQRGCFSVKMYTKMKELGPTGGCAIENMLFFFSCIYILVYLTMDG